MKYAQYLFISANVQIGRKSSTRATAGIHEFYVSVFIKDQRSAKFLAFSIRKTLPQRLSNSPGQCDRSTWSGASSEVAGEDNVPALVLPAFSPTSADCIGWLATGAG